MATLDLPARMENLGSFIAAIARAARDQGFTEKRVKEMELCLEEILVNIFEYAYPDHEGRVEVEWYQGHGREWVIRIKDQGVAFDGLSLQDPDVGSDISRRKVGGLGIYLVRRLADQVHYERQGEKNILTLIFLRP